MNYSNRFHITQKHRNKLSGEWLVRENEEIPRVTFIGFFEKFLYPKILIGFSEDVENYFRRSGHF